MLCDDIKCAEVLYTYFEILTYYASVITSLYCLFSVLVYICLERLENDYSKKIKCEKALIVTSHPDDECMFFGPTIYKLREAKVDVHILCLSDGGYYGNSSIRRQELYKSCSKLTVPDENIVIIRDTRHLDSPDLKWPFDYISGTILRTIETYDFDAVMSFDHYGVSGHLNHISVYNALVYLIIHKKIPENCSVYILDSVNVLRKYISFFDITISMLSPHWFILSWEQSRCIARAMKEHKSQMLWFRHLYILFSRYMCINTMRKITYQDFELELEHF